MVRNSQWLLIKKDIVSVEAAHMQHWTQVLSAYEHNLEFKATQQYSNADALLFLLLPQ